MVNPEFDELNCSGIYILYLSDKYFYIGQSKNYAYRTKKHLQNLKKGRHVNKRVLYTYKKYEMFVPRLLERCFISELNEREQFWLDTFYGTSGCINANSLATGGGRKMSEETKEKLRQANLGKRHSEESKKKVSIAHTGRRHSDASKKKMSEHAIQRAKSEEFLKKLSDSSRGKTLMGKDEVEKLTVAAKNNIGHSNSFSAVRQCLITGEELTVWSSAHHAAETLSLKRSSILRAISGERRSYASFTWRKLSSISSVF
jgi:group I intron endonuclease